MASMDPQLQGPLRAMYSHFWSDNYTKAEHIANLDSDALFHTMGLERLMVVEGKPVVWVQSMYPQHFDVVDALGFLDVLGIFFFYFLLPGKPRLWPPGWQTLPAL